MVDPTKGIGPIQNIAPGSKPQSSTRNSAQDVSSSNAPVDQVEISPEAQETLNVSQAETTARDVRTELQKDLDAFLGIDPSFAEQVIEL